MNALETISHIKLRWQRRLWLRSISWWLLTLALCTWLFLMSASYWVWVLAAAITIAILSYRVSRLPQQEAVVQLINEQIGDVQYSGALFIQDADTALGALQRRRALQRLEKVDLHFRFPVAWKDVMVVSVLSVLGAVLVSAVLPTDLPKSPQSELASTYLISGENAEVSDTTKIKGIRASIDPPQYTGLRRRVSEDPNLSLIEGAEVSWAVSFSAEPAAVWMVLNNEDSVALSKSGGEWVTRLQAKAAIYAIRFRDVKDQVFSTPYYAMQLVEDQPPEVQITDVPQFQRLEFSPTLSLPFKVRMSDDFGLSGGYLVATITKGSGEAVKFRELKIPFPKIPKGKSFTSTVELRISDYDMEPGNELYFYAYAEDNREPSHQSSRTETHFFVLKDTSQVEFSLQGALGVDLMPDYFRSQLQIILDTEKLVSEKRQMDTHDFNSASNALGFDQKALRLKYGQFIGEEEDSGLEVDRETPEVAPEGTEEDQESTVRRFGHDTDHENEEGEWMDRGADHDGHDHDHHGHNHGNMGQNHEGHLHEESMDPDAEEDPLEGFLHNHEDEETATFYTQTLKSKLRAALSEMWDAELYLRLYQPEKSLPYQYRAHELLKEIRNHARIYVQRIGFDPPSVNEAESRLSGDLDEIHNRHFEVEVLDEDDYLSIRRAIKVVSDLQSGEEFIQEMRDDLETAGTFVASLVMENPGLHLRLLNRLRSLIDLPKVEYAHLAELQLLTRELTSLLPSETQQPEAVLWEESPYTQNFVEQLSDRFTQ